MPSITLTVTAAVLDQVNGGADYQRQLAVQAASPQLRALLDTARANNRVNIQLCGAFNLSAGDTHAIFGVHQPAGVAAHDFTSIYELLARRPDVPITFNW